MAVLKQTQVHVSCKKSHFSYNVFKIRIRRITLYYELGLQQSADLYSSQVLFYLIYVEPQLCIKIIDKRISLNCINLDLLSPKPKLTFRHLKSGVAIALKTVNNAVVV